MAILGNVLGFISDNGKSILAIIGGGAVLATQTHNYSTVKVLNILCKAINLIGQNYGKAKNKEEK